MHAAQLMPLPLTSLSLASVKSRLVLPFWYWLTWVVPDKGPLNVCVWIDSCLESSFKHPPPKGPLHGCVCVCHTHYVYSFLVKSVRLFYVDFSCALHLFVHP